MEVNWPLSDNNNLVIHIFLYRVEKKLSKSCHALAFKKLRYTECRHWIVRNPERKMKTKYLIISQIKWKKDNRKQRARCNEWVSGRVFMTVRVRAGQNSSRLLIRKLEKDYDPTGYQQSYAYLIAEKGRDQEICETKKLISYCGSEHFRKAKHLN